MPRFRSQRGHEHRFRPEGSFDIDSEFDGDYVYVYTRCRHRPVLAEYTDDALCETYQETGDRCEAMRVKNYRVGAPTNLDTEETIRFEDDALRWEELVPPKADVLRQAAEEACCDEIVTTFGVDGTTYEIELTLEDIDVHEN